MSKVELDKRFVAHRREVEHLDTRVQQLLPETFRVLSDSFLDKLLNLLFIREHPWWKEPEVS
jgi:hypothetical protein